MKEKKLIVALDQGTTSSRSIAFDAGGKAIASSALPLEIRYPQSGWVEQNPREIWSTQSATLKDVLSKVGAENVLCLAISNQRETVIAWDRASGEPLTPAIVWQCRRTTDICAKLKESGVEPQIQQKTGLICDPYFSGSKIRWMLDHVSGLKEKVHAGQAVFGTVDTWVLFNLTGGKSFYSEPSNASRTMLFNINHFSWDPELCKLLGVTEQNLPRVIPSNSEFGEFDAGSCRIPIRAILGDQQASLYGHGCKKAGDIKCTFGTGAFLLLNTGSDLIRSKNQLISTIAWDIKTGAQSKREYAIEGSVFVAGAAIQWLRDSLGLIKSSAETEALAQSVSDSGGVIVMPAFVGLGAPFWKPNVRGGMVGLTRGTTKAHIVRATLEGVAHQVADLLDCEEFAKVNSLVVDGGMTQNRLFNQILADLCRREVRASAFPDITAKGVALLARDTLNPVGGISWTDDGLESSSPSRSEVSAENRRLWKRQLEALIQAA